MSLHLLLHYFFPSPGLSKYTSYGSFLYLQWVLLLISGDFILFFPPLKLFIWFNRIWQQDLVTLECHFISWVSLWNSLLKGGEQRRAGLSKAEGRQAGWRALFFQAVSKALLYHFFSSIPYRLPGQIRYPSLSSHFSDNRGRSRCSNCIARHGQLYSCTWTSALAKIACSQM